MMQESTHLFVYMPILSFVYGMSVLMFGITIAAERIAGEASDSLKKFIFSPLGSLSLFGLTLGSSELIEMSDIICGGLSSFPQTVQTLLMASSYAFLCCFGVSFASSGSPGVMRTLKRLQLPKVLFLLWSVLAVSMLLMGKGSGEELFLKIEVLSHYVIGLPASLAAAFALYGYRREAGPEQRKYLTIASAGFILYAFLVGVIVPKSDMFPSSFLNYESFYSAVLLPARLLRSLCIIVITIALLRFLRLSEEFSTIRFKTIMHIFITIVLPASIIIAFVCVMSAQSLLGLSFKRNDRIAALTAGRVASLLENVEKKVRYHVLLSKNETVSRREDIFRFFVAENPEINGIILTDTQGVIFSVIKDRLSKQGVRRAFNDDRRMERFLMNDDNKRPDGGFYIKGHDQENVYMEIPLVHGKVVVFLRPDSIYDVISIAEAEHRWHVLLFDDRGVPVEGKGFPLYENEILQRDMVQGDYGNAVDQGGVHYCTIEKKILPIGWSLVIGTPRSRIVAPVFRVYKGLFAGIVFVYAAAIVFAFTLADRIIKPVNILARRIKKISDGHFDPELSFKTGDEIQTLSEELEKMASSLSENKKTEARMVRTEKIASLGRLVSGIAHEINNPLGIILGYCQVLLREIDPGSRHLEDMKTIESHSLKCKKIVEDLLKFSRPYKQVNVAVDVNANIRETLALIPGFITGRIRMIFEPGHSSPVISGDPDKLHQLFLNLIMNAIDAMKDGGDLTIRTLEPGGAEGGVEVTFMDTGCGIKEDDMAKIFDPFFTTKEVGKGTGLGLSVSYGIVKDHGSEIWAESVEDKGTTFHIIFPKVEAYER